MTKYAVAVEDKQYTINVTRKGEEQFSIKIDDKPREVQLIKNKFQYETPLQIKIGEKTYTVQINKPNKRAPFTVQIKDIPIKAEVRTQQPTFTLQTPTTTIPTLIAMKTPIGKIVVEGAVTAPMAGKIVSVNVKKGDQVKVGAVLCILEAMKMENEIIAPKTGTVQEVNVTEGTTVSEGQVLVIVK